ncbi:MAG: TetR/AcrR family transcriptional regulator [Jatrophihabitans sp.]|uniref:TetR/AcrR family transcriptional regulator n=1 Tax=Jatrophihabitans sp. TaxID=1932789 RepID=UPI003F7E2D91
MASSRKQEISEETRRRLVDAAFELASEGGSAAMSVQAVAERSQISRGSVAWHFGSKDGLLVAVVDEAFRWGIGFITDRLAEAPKPTVDVLLEANFALMGQPKARIFSTILLEALTSDSPIRATYAAHYVELRAVYARYLATVAPKVGDVDALAVALLGSTLGINIQYRLDPERVDRRSAVEVLEHVYARALGRQRRGRATPQ